MADAAAIAAVSRAAFGGDEEVEIIARLERDGLVVLSLIARTPDRVEGHILFSVVDVSIDGRAVRALALAPMAVLPERQRRGIGSALIREGLRRVREAEWDAVFVLGHTEYYPRFGFSSALARKFASPFPMDAFMALELVPGALHGERELVTYPAAWGI